MVSDLISRQEVLQIIEQFEILDGYQDTIELIQKIQNLTSTQERKRGRNLSKARYFYCSECGYGVQDVFEGNNDHKDEVLVFEKQNEWNYCPNCGCRMEDNNESD